MALKLFRPGSKQTDSRKENAMKKLEGPLEKYRDLKIRLYLEIKGLGRLYVLAP